MEQTAEHISKYALKQKRLREERDFGTEYVIGATEEPETKVETIAEVAQKLSEKRERKKNIAEMAQKLSEKRERKKNIAEMAQKLSEKRERKKNIAEMVEDEDEKSQRNRWSRLPREEKDRLIGKWEAEVQSYLDTCSLLQSRIDKLKTAIGGFHQLISRNHKRIKEIKREGEI